MVEVAGAGEDLPAGFLGGGEGVAEQGLVVGLEFDGSAGGQDLGVAV